jgi:hypothetical protein
MKRVWPDTFVQEDSLTFNICTLRKALGGHPGGQQFIQTEHTVGYRFVAPVKILPPPLASSPPTETTLPAPRYDVFVCHATEDKTFVEPLVSAVKGAGITVWYDSDMMGWGDDLRASIDRGLDASRYGIVVFSKAFLKARRWTAYELNGLLAKERNGVKVVLPIWHDIGPEDLLQYSPALVDRLAMDSKDVTVNEIAQRLKAIMLKAL